MTALAKPHAEYVTTRQACEYLECGHRTLYAAAEAGGWETIPLSSGTTLWRMKDVESFRIARDGSAAEREGRQPQDRFSEKGAKALAAMIRDYWHKRGYAEADVWAEQYDGGFEPQLRTAQYWVIRSNLVNGWPPGRRGE